MDPRPPPQGPPAFDRDRDRDQDQHLADHARQRSLQQQAELVQQMEQARNQEYAAERQKSELMQQREREFAERQERDRQVREHFGGPVPPHQNTATPMTIHQPQASRLSGAIHSPGGLLANHGGAPPAGPLGAPSGPGNAFGGPLHSEANRNVPQNPQSSAAPLQQQHQSFAPSILGHNPTASNVAIGNPGASVAGFGGAIQAQQHPQAHQEAANRLQQIPFGPPVPAHQVQGAPALGQGGQQPILNVSLHLAFCMFGFRAILRSSPRLSRPDKMSYITPGL